MPNIDLKSGNVRDISCPAPGFSTVSAREPVFCAIRLLTIFSGHSVLSIFLRFVNNSYFDQSLVPLVLPPYCCERVQRTSSSTNLGGYLCSFCPSRTAHVYIALSILDFSRLAMSFSEYVVHLLAAIDLSPCGKRGRDCDRRNALGLPCALHYKKKLHT